MYNATHNDNMWQLCVTISLYNTFAILDVEYIAWTINVNTRKNIYIITKYNHPTLSITTFLNHL